MAKSPCARSCRNVACIIVVGMACFWGVFRSLRYTAFAAWEVEVHIARQIECATTCAAVGLPRSRCFQGDDLSYLPRDAFISNATLTAPYGAGAADRPPRMLVILGGGRRGGPAAWGTVHTHILDRYTADLMVVLPQPFIEWMRHNHTSPSRVANQLLLKRAKHVVAVPEFDDWADVYDLMEADMRSRTPSHKWPLPWRARLNQYGSCAPPKSGHCIRPPRLDLGIIVSAYRWYAKRAVMDLQLSTAYEWFMYTRTDMYIYCPLQLPPLALRSERRVMFVPQGEDYGACDALKVGNNN